MRNGDLNAAYRAAEESYRIASRIGVNMTVCTGTTILGTIEIMRGNYESAQEWFETGLQAARPMIDFLPFYAALPLGGLGLACLDISPKLAGQATEYLTEAKQLLEAPYGALAAGITWGDLGFSALALGEIDNARAYFQNGLTMTSPFTQLQRPRLLAGSAIVAMAEHEMDRAQELIEEALHYAEERSMKFFYPLLEYADGLLHYARSDMQSALEHFTKAETLALEMQMRPMVWRARMEAARALSALGSQKEANKKVREAKDMIAEIASIFPDENKCKLFTENAMGQLDAAGGRR
jgi:tetratricopeptide (TPR) repeat protein